MMFRHPTRGGLQAIVLAFVLSVSDPVPALSPDVGPSPPTTFREQAGQLSRFANRGLARELFPYAAEEITPKRFYQRDYRAPWRSATPYERTLLAERIGNQGRARFGAERGWTKIVGSQGRGIAQGPDAVYWDPYSGKLRVLEAKGGSSQVKWTYGAVQGTNTNAVRSAEHVLRSAKATQAEQVAAARVIKAAQQNRLETAVVKTRHVLGRPQAPRVEGEWSRTPVAQEAVQIERRLVFRNARLARTFKAAGRAQESELLRYRASTGMAAVGLASSALIGWDAYQESKHTLAMLHDPGLRGTPLPYLHAGLAAGKWGESAALGLGSAAGLRLLAQGPLRALGHRAGTWFLPIAVGVQGLTVGTALYEYSLNRISQREFYRRSTGPAIFAVFTTGGAIIGGIAGSPAGGVGAAPAAAAGAGIGAVVAIPVQLVADWSWNRYYRKFDEHEQAAVDAAVERYYGVRD